MADSDVNPEQSLSEPRPIPSSTAASSGSASPSSERPTENSQSQNVALESTRIYVEPVSAKDWRDDQRLEELKLDPSKNPKGIGRLAHYEILGFVGRGAMGVVLKAFDEQLHRQVAIKLMSPELVSRPTARERFFREARAAAGINHPNVVTIHAVSEHHGLPYLVMEFVSGMTLADRIHRQTPLPTPDILRLCVQITDGLAAAHKKGIIHRDVKPANIMLEDGLERVKITDFGLARVAMENSDLTSFGDMVGTPAFMSPEQVDGLSLDARSDLFSLGCVIYAMVAGKSPFRSGNALATARRVITVPHQSLREISPDVPTYLVDITDRLLQKQPADRYESAEALQQELSQRLAEQHLTADDSSTLLRMSRTLLPASDRKGRRAWFAIATLLVVVIGSIEGFRIWQHSHTVITEAEPPIPKTPSPPEVPGTKVVTVAADGSADFRRLSDAFRRVLPGDTVRVIDAARYEIPVRIDSAELYSNMTLEATAGATLASAASGTPVLTIQGTPGVHVRGFTLETSGLQHAIELTGACSGLVIEDCVLRSKTPGEAGRAMIYLHGAASGVETSPIQLRRLRIENGGVGIVVGGHEETTEVSHVLITDCQIRGTTRDYGVPVVLLAGVRAVVVTRNLISTGTTGVNLYLPDARRVVAVAVTDNTFHNVGQFVTLTGSPDQDLRFVSNLVLESNGVSLSEGSVADIRKWFEGNWWERSSGNDESLIAQVARVITYVPLRSREWDSSDFLTPAADAPPDLPGRFGQRESPTTQRAPSSGKQE